MGERYKSGWMRKFQRITKEDKRENITERREGGENDSAKADAGVRNENGYRGGGRLG